MLMLWSTTIVDFIWRYVLWLVLGAGIVFTLYCRFIPFRYLWHGIVILTGKYDNKNDPGQLSHFKALSTALASTVGMGNLAGVAVAITLGGPGALFWMWVTAILGMGTKFFTCTLSVLFRTKEADGSYNAGPMVVIKEALPKKYHFLAVWFALAGCVGCLPLFQVNQLVMLLQSQLESTVGTTIPYMDVTIGLVIVGLTWFVIKDGLPRIAKLTSTLVPFMVLLYVFIAGLIIIQNLALIPTLFHTIITSAFTPSATLSGGLAVVMIQGIKRGAFSNEAGIGTEALAHGTAKTTEPIREGLVAMLGPVLDTLLICTLTGLVILIAQPQLSQPLTGIALTSGSITALLGAEFGWLFFICVIAFSFSTLIGYSFYSFKCVSFLFGKQAIRWFIPVYLILLMVAAVLSIDIILNLVDTAFGLMAIPTLLSSILLAPVVMKEATAYFYRKIREEYNG